MTVGITWGTASLLCAAGAVIAVPTTLLAGPPFALTIACVLLVIAAVSLLVLMIVTLPRADAFDEAGPPRDLHPILAWPMRVGWGIGALIIGLALLGITLTTPGGGVASASSRFAMSLLAVFGMMATLFAAHALPAAALLTLLSLWGAVILLAIVRGIVGFVARLVQATGAR